MSAIKKKESRLLVPDLKENESILWNQNASIDIKPLLRNSCIPILLLLFTPIVLDSVVQAAPASLIIIIPLYNVFAPILFALLIIYIIYIVFQSKRTNQYLTTDRLLVTRNGKILKEIPRVNLQGLATNQFMSFEWQKQNLGHDYYVVTITDSISGISIIMTSVDKKSIDLIERWIE
ncbi:hypothetical protein EU527_18975 [Candidatus Thorarchaeota archaeon]|nr:MAG: hypothetical protein EU527_18975 [Candidatus Thorarchaeota archaeon]